MFRNVTKKALACSLTIAPLVLASAGSGGAGTDRSDSPAKRLKALEDASAAFPDPVIPDVSVFGAPPGPAAPLALSGMPALKTEPDIDDEKSKPPSPPSFPQLSSLTIGFLKRNANCSQAKDMLDFLGENLTKFQSVGDARDGQWSINEKSLKLTMNKISDRESIKWELSYQYGGDSGTLAIGKSRTPQTEIKIGNKIVKVPSDPDRSILTWELSPAFQKHDDTMHKTKALMLKVKIDVWKLFGTVQIPVDPKPLTAEAKKVLRTLRKARFRTHFDEQDNVQFWLSGHFKISVSRNGHYDGHFYLTYEIQSDIQCGDTGKSMKIATAKAPYADTDIDEEFIKNMKWNLHGEFDPVMFNVMVALNQMNAGSGISNA